jgi:hypothetical protein
MTPQAGVQEHKKGRFVKLTKQQSEQLNEEANRLYDKYNPRPHEHINVPKDQCIKEAKQRLGFSK